jgi:hypothetical protein
MRWNRAQASVSSRRLHRDAVGELLPRVLRLDERAVAADAHSVGEREEHVRVQALGVALVRPGSQEQITDGVDPGSRECPVVASDSITRLYRSHSPLLMGVAVSLDFRDLGDRSQAGRLPGHHLLR